MQNIKALIKNIYNKIMEKIFVIAEMESIISILLKTYSLAKNSGVML